MSKTRTRVPLGSRLIAALVAIGWLVPSMASANPPLMNPSFEIVGPDGSPTVHSPPAPGGAGLSAAESWGVFHNTAPGATTVTELVATTLPVAGAGLRMIHVEADSALNGINQVTGPPGSGPTSCTASGWVFVKSGVVGMGAGDHGNTNPFDILTTTTGAWEYLQVPNGFSPCNQIIFYAIGGGADYNVELAQIKEFQEVDKLVDPLEYSNFFDERSIDGGGDHNGLDPGQVLYTEPIDTAADSHPIDVVDFFPLVESDNEPDLQVDALANGCDALFNELRDDREILIFSVESDLGTVSEVGAYFEDPSGAGGIQYTHRDLNAVNLSGDIDDVDGLEMWRLMDDAMLGDASFYSLQGDVTGTAIFSYLSGSPVPYLSSLDILGAINSLGFDGEPGDADVDALMVKDTGSQGVWDIGDEVLFSIRARNAWDGGEIVHWRFGAAADFLEHGGHKWDTSFDVGALIEVDVEEVDAIEAVPVPEPALWLGLVSGASWLAWLSRRRG